LIVLAVAAAAPSFYLLGLLAAAAAKRDQPPPSPAARPRFAVVVPAHDEEAGVAATVASLCDAGCTPIVIADNCTDATAERARAAGATVWERVEPDRRGKGEALAWAFERLAAEVEAVAIVDADCTVSANLIDAFAARLAGGARAVQASYMVSNPAESPAAAARYAGYALINHVRPLGKSALGLSCGLLGSGMAFEAALLREHPWSAFDVTEDTGYHLRLVEAGERVEFAPEARVESAMPETLDAAESQRERWESGGFDLARRTAGRLIALGLRRRDPSALNAGVELLVPPQSLLLAANAATAAAAAATGARAARRVALLGLGAQAAYVLGGLALVRAPAPVWRALSLAPVLAARNAGLYARLVRGRRPAGWVRTAR
jgi:1,2-diacylglycerol 3-beta-glucosyltransferase